MPSYQIIRVYNRLPYPVEYQWDQQSDAIPAHSSKHLSYEMAVAAIKSSVVYMDPDDLEEVIHGCVPEQDEDFEVPLTQEEVDEIQDIPGWQMGVHDPENYKANPVKKQPRNLVKGRRGVSKGITITTVGSEVD